MYANSQNRSGYTDVVKWFLKQVAFSLFYNTNKGQHGYRFLIAGLKYEYE